jgi:SPP1 gp7 family putative phage head morphogenesis protein
MWKVSADPTRPEEAIAWFRARVPLTREEWNALTAQVRRKAFTVSGVALLDVVAEVWESLTEALEDGTPYREWADGIRDRLEAAWGRRDGQRVETIFRTNVQMAYQSGRWAQLQDPEVKATHPYLMYDAVLDNRTTEICRSRNGTVLPADDPWWAQNWPPLHFNCRSGVRPITEAEASRRGIRKPPAIPPQKGFGSAPESWEWSPKPEDYPLELLAAFKGRPYGDPERIRRSYLALVEKARKKVEGLKKKYNELSRLIEAGEIPIREAITQKLALLERMDHWRQAGVWGRKLFYRRDAITGPGIEVEIVSPELERVRKKIEEVVREFYLVTGQAGKVRIGLTERNRSFYSDFEGAVYISNQILDRTGLFEATLVHEMGHWLEDRANLIERTRAYLLHRSGGRPPVDLGDVMGPEYRGEMAYLGVPTFVTPYAGKFYRQQGTIVATELVSVGMEHLLTDTLSFAQGDPDHFRQVLEWTRGRP